MVKHLFIVHLFGHLSQHCNQRIDDSILIFHHLGKNPCQNLIQLLAADLRCRAGSSALLPVDLALPHLLIPRCALQHLPVEGGSMFLADDFGAVRITIMIGCSAAV